ncbi:uncharacterized protein LOC143275830 [Babylonia areolata]|uniref:uncharacterized protein LOC143275830 n=1 Tax=Babylonia areolata TaxID=304850 RepID=UPI003FD1306F
MWYFATPLLHCLLRFFLHGLCESESGVCFVSCCDRRNQCGDKPDTAMNSYAPHPTLTPLSQPGKLGETRLSERSVGPTSRQCCVHCTLPKSMSTAMSLLRKLFVCSETSSGGGGGRRKETDTNTCSEADGFQTECAVCQDRLTEPCTIPCGNHHVFCLTCLKGLSTHRSHRNHFPCPLCRKLVRIPLGGVTAFRDNKTLGQKLRSKLPAFRPRSRHRRRRPRSGLRSADYVTVSFPVLGYSDELEMDILSTLYTHREGQAVNRERLMEAILDEIGHVRDMHPSDSRHQNGLWLGEDVGHSDSDQDDTLSDVHQPSVPDSRRSSDFPRPVDTEDFDMSVVLQIIADMEENDRRREASQGSRPTPADCPVSQALGNGVSLQTADTGTDRSQTAQHASASHRSDTSNISSAAPRTPETGNATKRGAQSDNTVSPTSETNDVESHRSETSGHTSQRSDTDSAVSQTPVSRTVKPRRSESYRAASRRSAINDAMPERPDSWATSSERRDVTSQRPESRSAMSERPESRSAATKRPESRSATSERPESRGAATKRPESRSAMSERPESRGAATKRPESRSAMSERPESRGAATKRPESLAVAAEWMDTNTVRSQRPETHGSSLQKTEVNHSVSQRSACGRGHPGRASSTWWAVRHNTDSARPQRSGEGLAGLIAARSSSSSSSPLSSSSSSSLQSPPGNFICDNTVEPCPFNTTLENDLGFSDYAFVPRPRMGSFKLAIAAGQTVPAQYKEDSPSLSTLTRQSCTSAPGEGVTRDTVSSRVQSGRLVLPAEFTKGEIKELPVRIDYIHRQTTNQGPRFEAEQRSEEQLFETTNTDVTGSEEQLIDMMDCSDRYCPQTRHTTQRILTVPQDRVVGNSRETLQQLGFRSLCKDTRKAALLNDLPTPRQVDTSEIISHTTQQQSQRDERIPGQNERQASEIPTTTATRAKQRERSSKPSVATTLSHSLSERATPREVTRPHRDPQTEAGSHLLTRAAPDKDTISGLGVCAPDKDTAISGLGVYAPDKDTAISGLDVYAPDRDTAISGLGVYAQERQEEEWASRLRGVQRRVMCRTSNSGARHTLRGTQAPAVTSTPHPHTLTTLFADDHLFLMDGHSGLDVVHV